MIQTVVAVLVGIVGVCLAVVGGVLLEVAIGEWRLRRKMGELAPGPGSTDDLVRPTVAAVLLVVAGIVIVALVVAAQLWLR